VEAFDLWRLYEAMLRSRLLEEAIAQLWHDGLISGEMHMSTGEEAIAAGVLDHLSDGDSLALDHRATAPLLIRGIDPVLLLRELLGRRDGLCHGMGGHMHLFSPEHLAASSGIVGASGPAAIGFALAGRHLRPGKVTVAFFGEAAMNQGMLLEALNLAVVWKLPILFVCKDNDWAITTLSAETTGGDLATRARAFGMEAVTGDGSDLSFVWEAARAAVARARAGEGPTFLHLHCWRPERHFLGDPLVRIVRHPVAEISDMAGPMLRAALRRGSGLRARVAGLNAILGRVRKTWQEEEVPESDPLLRARQQLESEEARLVQREEAVVAAVKQILDRALAPEEELLP
jgi:pyruvate dehydrogenase E1 component alpha subunit